MAEWVVFAAAWVVFAAAWVVFTREWEDSTAEVMPAQDFVADSLTEDSFMDTVGIGDTIAIIQTTGLFLGLAILTGPIMAADGGIRTTVTLPTRYRYRIHTPTSIQIMAMPIPTTEPIKVPAHKQMENRCI